MEDVSYEVVQSDREGATHLAPQPPQSMQRAWNGFSGEPGERQLSLDRRYQIPPLPTFSIVITISHRPFEIRCCYITTAICRCVLFPGCNTLIEHHFETRAGVLVRLQLYRLPEHNKNCPEGICWQAEDGSYWRVTQHVVQLLWWKKWINTVLCWVPQSEWSIAV